MSRFNSSSDKNSWGQRNFDSEILTGLANLFLVNSVFSGYKIVSRRADCVLRFAFLYAGLVCNCMYPFYS